MVTVAIAPLEALRATARKRMQAHQEPTLNTVRATEVVAHPSCMCMESGQWLQQQAASSGRAGEWVGWVRSRALRANASIAYAACCCCLLGNGQCHGRRRHGSKALCMARTPYPSCIMRSDARRQGRGGGCGKKL